MALGHLHFKIQIHVIATNLKPCPNYDNSPWDTQPPYMVLKRLAVRTFGQFVPVDYTANGAPTGDDAQKVPSSCLRFSNQLHCRNYRALCGLIEHCKFD